MAKEESTAHVLSSLTDSFKDLSRALRGNSTNSVNLCQRIPRHMVPFNGGNNAEELEAYLDCVLTVAEERSWNRAKILSELRSLSCDRFLHFLTYQVEPNWEISEEFNDRV